jgi:lipid-binding SYLF domain-containing protein
MVRKIKATNQLKRIKMKKNSVTLLAGFLLIFMGLSMPSLKAQDGEKTDKLIADAKEARSQFVSTDNLMESLFNSSAGYVIFPNVGKGAIGVGGAAGNGVVFEKGKAVGTAKMKQVSVGFQFGGQVYREVIFFQDQAALNRFKQNKFEFSAQASAVAVTKGASTNVKYRNGVLVFTQEKGGLMYEASIGGQKFSYKSL